MKRLLLASILTILAVPIGGWAMYKPVRVLAPDWVEGIKCVDSEICMEDESRYRQAKSLYDEALLHVSSVTGPFRHHPRVIFCSTENCYRSFGFRKASATAVGTSGIVVSPRGWKDFYLRHEMIHHRQAEEFGVLASLFKPEWLIEGMAYALSGDSRKQLSERWQTAREKFRVWLNTVGRDHLWREAMKI